MIRRALTMLALGAACAGCRGAMPPVSRVVDGRTVEGQFVGARAYALFLRGAVAEESGRLDEAIRDYEAVTAWDTGDAEVFARIAAVRCKRDPADPRAREAVIHALSIDPQYGPAWAAAAACATPAEAMADLRKAAAAEPASIRVQLSFTDALDRAGAPAEAGRRLVALTLAEPQSGAAWSALGAWAEAHDDVALAARAWAELARVAPMRQAEVARRAAALAGEGQLAPARDVAAALLRARRRRDHGGAPLSQDLLRPVALLAVDSALARGDGDAARAFATAGHLRLDEVAARAVALGQGGIARAIAGEVAAADPKDAGARLILAAGGDASALAGDGAGVASASPLACLVFLRALTRGAGDEAARAAYGALACAPVPDDAVATPIAVDLAARGVLPDAALGPAARVELALRMQRAVSGVDRARLDARHRFALLAYDSPASPEAARLAARFARRHSRDPLVLSGMVRVAAASGHALGARDGEAIAQAAPSDPIVYAALVQALTPKQPGAAARVRARLAAVAVTPAERRLAY